MRYETLELLRCPAGCDGPLSLRADGERGGRVEAGRLACGGCGAGYAVEAGIARMLPVALGAETGARADAVQEETARKRSEMAARDAQAEDYDRMKGLALFGRAEIPVTLRYLRPDPGDALLEAGCGTGRMTQTFAARARSLVALDFSFESLRACRGKLERGGVANVDLIQADVCALPLRSDAFDRVVSCQVLEHIPTPDSRARMVFELARAAKPGGRVVVSAYQHSLYTRLFGRKEGAHAGGIYYYRFGRGELRELLSRSLEVQGMTGALVYHYLARCRKPSVRC